MNNVEIYIDKNNRLKVMVRKFNNLEKIDLNLRGSNALKYIKRFYNKNITSTRDDGYNKFISGNDFSITIFDYKKMMKKLETLKPLIPILEKARGFEEKENLRKLKGKKVERVNKHALRTVSLVSLAAIAAGIVFAENFTNENTNDITVRKVDSYTENGMDHYIFEVVDDDLDKEKGFTVEESPYDNIVEEDPIIEVGTTQQVGDVKEETTEEASYSEDVQAPIDNTNEIEQFETVYLDYPDESKSEKAYNAYLNYFDIISKYARMYGLDERLMMAVATQESGVHSTDLTGPAVGLMMIEKAPWVGKDITGYNFETQSYKTLHVTLENLQDLNFNVEASCILFQNGLISMDYNPILGLQAYNMGDPNMQIILNAYSENCGRNIDSIKNTKTDLGWLDYTYLPGEGDSEYVRNVLQFLGDDCTIVNTKPTGEKVGITIKSLENRKIY